jgi:hypothetical protein
MPHCRSRTRGDRAPQVGEDQALVEAPWTAVVERRAGPVGHRTMRLEGLRVSAQGGLREAGSTGLMRIRVMCRSGAKRGGRAGARRVADVGRCRGDVELE